MKYLFSLIIAALVSLPTFSQTSIGFKNRFIESGSISSVQFELQLTGKWNLISMLSYYDYKVKDWSSLRENAISSDLIIPSLGKRYNSATKNELSNGLGAGIGFTRSDFILKNLTFISQIELWRLDRQWVDQDCRASVMDFPCTINVYQTNNDLNTYLSFGLGFDFYVSEQFFIKPTLNIGFELFENKFIEASRQPSSIQSLIFGTQFGAVF